MLWPHSCIGRLGMLAGSSKDIFDHPFCENVDSVRLLRKEIDLPFIPKLASPTDTSNFAEYSADEEPTCETEDEFELAKHEETWKRVFGSMEPA